MEPQPGSPTSPPFSPAGTALWDNTRAATPSEEMAAPDETKEEATELEPGRKSSASSSSSSSSSSADIPCDIDGVEFVNPSAAPLPDDEHGKAEVKPVHSATPEDERAGPDVHGAEAKPDDGQAAPAVTVHSAEAKPDDWVTWTEPPPPVMDESFVSSDSSASAPPPVMDDSFVSSDSSASAPPPVMDDSFVSSDSSASAGSAPQVHTVSPANLGPTAAGGSGFDPGRIPASVFQHRASVSQAEWSIASNESLFSIQGGDMYPPSRSHFDFYYDEAMAADSKLPSLEEGAEPPESGRGGNNAKKAAAFRRHESGSGGSSSNFSFAFPILAETSPRKKDPVNSALYRPEAQQPPPQQQVEPPVSAFMEMTTEEERRRSDSGCCCCGCCWFDFSLCCRCPWWRCGCCCRCSCPSFCRCSWCLCS